MGKQARGGCSDHRDLSPSSCLQSGYLFWSHVVHLDECSGRHYDHDSSVLALLRRVGAVRLSVAVQLSHRDYQLDAHWHLLRVGTVPADLSALSGRHEQGHLGIGVAYVGTWHASISPTRTSSASTSTSTPDREGAALARPRPICRPSRTPSAAVTTVPGQRAFGVGFRYDYDPSSNDRPPANSCWRDRGGRAGHVAARRRQTEELPRSGRAPGRSRGPCSTQAFSLPGSGTPGRATTPSLAGRRQKELLGAGREHSGWASVQHARAATEGPALDGHEAVQGERVRPRRLRVHAFTGGDPAFVTRSPARAGERDADASEAATLDPTTRASARRPRFVVAPRQATFLVVGSTVSVVAASAGTMSTAAAGGRCRPRRWRPSLRRSSSEWPPAGGDEDTHWGGALGCFAHGPFLAVAGDQTLVCRRRSAVGWRVTPTIIPGYGSTMWLSSAPLSAFRSLLLFAAAIPMGPTFLAIGVEPLREAMITGSRSLSVARAGWQRLSGRRRRACERRRPLRRLQRGRACPPAKYDLWWWTSTPRRGCSSAALGRPSCAGIASTQSRPRPGSPTPCSTPVGGGARRRCGRRAAPRATALWHYDGTSWRDVDLPDDVALDRPGDSRMYLRSGARRRRRYLRRRALSCSTTTAPAGASPTATRRRSSRCAATPTRSSACRWQRGVWINEREGARSWDTVRTAIAGRVGDPPTAPRGYRAARHVLFDAHWRAWEGGRDGPANRARALWGDAQGDFWCVAGTCSRPPSTPAIYHLGAASRRSPPPILRPRRMSRGRVDLAPRARRPALEHACWTRSARHAGRSRPQPLSRFRRALKR